MPSRRRAIDTSVSRFETEYDAIVELGLARRLAEALAAIKRLRAWTRRHTRYGGQDWHEAELLWLEGVILTRSRRERMARVAWMCLAEMFERHEKVEAWFLPACPHCRERRLPFAPSWFETAIWMREHPGRDRIQDLHEAASSGEWASENVQRDQ